MFQDSKSWSLYGEEGQIRFNLIFYPIIYMFIQI